MVSRAQLLYAALLVVGLVLLGAGFFLLGQPEYTHVAEPIDESAVPADATAIPFQDLPLDDRRTLSRALDAPGETVAVSASNRVAAFQYGDVREDHYVERDGEYFRVVPGGGGGVLSGVDEIVAWVLLAFGTLAVMVAGRDLWRHRGQTG